MVVKLSLYVAINDERGTDMDVVGKCAESDDNSGETRGSNSNINSILCLVTNFHSLIYHPITAKFNHCMQSSSLRHTGDSRIKEISILLKSESHVYISKAGDYLITDSLVERGPILLDVPNGRNELVIAAYSTQIIPKLYPIVGLCKEILGIALPPPVPLDLPKLSVKKKITSVISYQHQQVVREKPFKTCIFWFN